MVGLLYFNKFTKFSLQCIEFWLSLQNALFLFSKYSQNSVFLGNWTMVCPWCLLFLNINLHFTIVDRLLKVFSVCCFLPFQIISTYAIGFFFNEDMLNSDHVIRDVNTITPSRTAVGWVGSVFPSVLFCTSFCHIGPDRPGYEVPGHPPTQGGEIPECSSRLKAPRTWK